MGFLDSLDKILNTATDVCANVLNVAADSIDKKNEEELQHMCAKGKKTPEEMREFAAQAHMLYEQRRCVDDDYEDDYDS